MPVIQAEPGDWIDLFGKLFTIALDPIGKTNGFQGNEAGLFGPFIYWIVQLNPEKRSKLSDEAFQLIAHSNPDKLDIGQSSAKLVYGLITSGHILAYVLRLGRYNARIASVESAVRILEQRYTQEGSPASPARIKAAWSKYKYLSPFVVGFFSEGNRAAPIVKGMPQFWDTSDGLKRDVPINPQGIQSYLSDATSENPSFNRYFTEVVPYAMAMADKFRQAGEEHFAPGQEVRNKPLLDPEHTWHLPESFKLPKVVMRLERLDAEELNAATSA
ncbi:MAG: hypothetical protein RIC29_04205 [Rhodospirillaceae bacterium]